MNRTPTPHIPVGRRRLLVGLVAVPLLAAIAACGSKETETADTAAPPTTEQPSTVPPTTEAPTTEPPPTQPPTTEVPAGIDYPRDASTAVIKLYFAGGFVPQGADFAAIPTLVISGDGKVYVEGVTTMEFPGPFVRPVVVRDITEAGILQLLAKAEELGLLGPAPDYTGGENVADAADTIVEITTSEGTFVHSAYALDLEEDDRSEARETLQSYVDLLRDLEGTVGAELGEESIYEPESYRFMAFPVDEAALDGIDPEPTIVNWSDEISVALRDVEDCASLPASEIGAFFNEVDSNTYFHEGDGETATLYQVVARAELPGDAPC